MPLVCDKSELKVMKQLLVYNDRTGGIFTKTDLEHPFRNVLLKFWDRF